MKEPKIRFKEFEGEWEDHTLGDFGHISMCKRIFKNQTSPDGDIPFFKIGTFGYTPDAYISRKLYEEYRQLYPFPHKGDILISAAGTIGRTVEYMGEDAYYQDSNIVWLNHSNDIDNKFLKYLYSHTNWNNLEGATIKRLYNSILLSTKSNCPSLAEQQKIASFFTTIDAQISASTSRLASLKQIKAASLQAMFPQEGETVPKLRFKGFEGEWEKVKLGEIGSWSKGRLLSKSDLEKDGKYRCIHYGELFVFYGEVINNVISKTNINNGCFSQFGDILFPDSDVTPNGLARCSSVMIDNVVLGGGIIIFRLFGHNNSSFISYAINVEKKQIINSVTGTTVRHINSSALSKINIRIPEEAEQRAIASYFTNLDRQITLQARRLEKLKQIKAACLDKMFV